MSVTRVFLYDDLGMEQHFLLIRIVYDKSPLAMNPGYYEQGQYFIADIPAAIILTVGNMAILVFLRN